MSRIIFTRPHTGAVAAPSQREPFLRFCILCPRQQGDDIPQQHQRVLAVLDAQQAQGDSEQTFTGGVLRITPERVQLVFDDKPVAEIRDIVKQWGFRWAPSQGAWQRQNTANGRYAAKQAIKAIEEVAQ